MTIMPEGEDLRNAVKWISKKRLENPEINLNKLIEKTGAKFDLSPKDVDFLTRFVKNNN